MRFIIDMNLTTISDHAASLDVWQAHEIHH